MESLYFDAAGGIPGCKEDKDMGKAAVLDKSWLKHALIAERIAADAQRGPEGTKGRHLSGPGLACIQIRTSRKRTKEARIALYLCRDGLPIFFTSKYVSCNRKK